MSCELQDQRKLEQFTLEYGDRIVKRLIEAFQSSRDPVVVDQILQCPKCKCEIRPHQLVCCDLTSEQFQHHYLLSNGISLPVETAIRLIKRNE